MVLRHRAIPLRRTAICLLAGLLTTILTAWAASLQPTRGLVIPPPGMSWRLRDPAKGEGEGWLRAHVAYKPGWRSLFGQAVPHSTYSTFTPTSVTPEQAIPRFGRGLALPWVEGARPWPPGTSDELVNVDEYGWPAPALYTRSWSLIRTATDEYLLDLTRIPWFAHRPLGELRGLPCGILWRGLALDSVLWAAAWSPVVMFAPARRALRRRRGLCIHCAYDLRASPVGAVCPECGV